MSEWSFEVLGWWLAITVGASLLSALFYPIVSYWITGFGASLRSFVRLFYAATAPATAGLSVVLLTQPTLSGLFITAHCHGDQCGAHAPVYAHDSVIILGLAAISSLVVLLLLLALLWTLRRAHRQYRVLNAIADRDRHGYQTLDSDELLACCVGLWKPKVLLSRGLIQQLQPEELAIVLSHERAHADRLDNLRALLLRWLTLFWPRSLRKRIGGDSRADAEQACDHAAARTGSGSAQVAAVIRRLSALSSATATAQAECRIGFDGDDSVTRLMALDRDSQSSETSLGNWLKAFVYLSLNWVLLIYLFTAGSHELIEWLGSVTR